MKLKLNVRPKFPPERKVKPYSEYAPNHKHVPVIFFGPKDFDDWKLFEKKANKILSQFKYIQGIVTLDQRTFSKTNQVIHGCLLGQIGIGSYGMFYTISIPAGLREKPYRTRCTIFSEREIKKPIKRNKEMFKKAKELSVKKPFALIFNDGSKEVKQFIKMCRKRKIKRTIVHLEK